MYVSQGKHGSLGGMRGGGGARVAPSDAGARRDCGLKRAAAPVIVVGNPFCSPHTEGAWRFLCINFAARRLNAHVVSLLMGFQAESRAFRLPTEVTGRNQLVRHFIDGGQFQF